MISVIEDVIQHNSYKQQVRTQLRKQLGIKIHVRQIMPTTTAFVCKSHGLINQGLLEEPVVLVCISQLKLHPPTGDLWIQVLFTTDSAPSENKAFETVCGTLHSQVCNELYCRHGHHNNHMMLYYCKDCKSGLPVSSKELRSVSIQNSPEHLANLFTNTLATSLQNSLMDTSKVLLRDQGDPYA